MTGSFCEVASFLLICYCKNAELLFIVCMLVVWVYVTGKVQHFGKYPYLLWWQGLDEKVHALPVSVC